MKAMKKILLTLCSIALALTCLIIPAATAKADVADPIPYDGNGVFFGQGIWHSDVVTTNGTINFGGPKSKTKYVAKLRMSMGDYGYDREYPYYPQDELYLYSKDNTAELVSVKSSSKNLRCIVSNKETKQYTKGNTIYPSQQASFLAKKAGSYKVTATIKLANGKKVKKKATVLVTKKPEISMTYSGKSDKNSYKFTSSKVKVKATPGQKVSGIKLYYCNSFNNETKNKDGSFSYYNKWTKLKNGGNIKLNTKTSYTIVEVDSYESSSYSRKTTTTTVYDAFYPTTEIKVIYKDKFYGVTNVLTYSIEKHKKH